MTKATKTAMRSEKKRLYPNERTEIIVEATGVGVVSDVVIVGGGSGSDGGVSVLDDVVSVFVSSDGNNDLVIVMSTF